MAATTDTDATSCRMPDLAQTVRSLHSTTDELFQLSVVFIAARAIARKLGTSGGDRTTVAPFGRPALRAAQPLRLGQSGRPRGTHRRPRCGRGSDKRKRGFEDGAPLRMDAELPQHALEMVAHGRRLHAERAGYLVIALA